LWNEDWIEVNFCSDFVLLNVAIARSRHRNGRYEF
jgi:hypothetical protein